MKVGKNKGVHYVFESTTEAIQYLTGELAHLNRNNQDLSNPLKAFPIWSEAERWDWCKADDGYIMQCFNRWENIRKHKKTGLDVCFKSGEPVTSKMFCFVVGNFAIWNKADGSWSPTRAYAAIKTVEDATKSRHSISKNAKYLGKYKTHKKLMFATYLAMYKDPFEALKKVQKQFGMAEFSNQDTRLHKKWTKIVLEALADPYVQEELKKLNFGKDMDEFKESVKESLKRYGLATDDSIVAIKGILTSCKSPIATLEAAKMNLHLQRFVADETGEILHDGTKKGGDLKGKLENAKFVEIEQEKFKVEDALPELNEPIKSNFATKMAEAVEASRRESNPTLDDILPAE